MFLEAKTEVKRATAGFAISLISGVLVLLNGILLIVIAARFQDILDSLGMGDFPQGRSGWNIPHHDRRDWSRIRSSHSDRILPDLHSGKRNLMRNPSTNLRYTEHLHRRRANNRDDPWNHRRSIRVS